MKEMWADVGKLVFWVNWPFLYLYLLNSKRTRVLIVAEGKVLLTKGWLSTGEWGLPGGGLHRKETPLAGALRELYEETGIRLKPKQVKAISPGMADENGLKFKYYPFFAKLTEATPVRKKSFEIVESAWLPIVDINDRNTDQTTIDVLSDWMDRK
jgi:8-oxo-dGTP pyrophosphatase MutT (NUDIX family)